MNRVFPRAHLLHVALVVAFLAGACRLATPMRPEPNIVLPTTPATPSPTLTMAPTAAPTSPAATYPAEPTRSPSPVPLPTGSPYGIPRDRPTGTVPPAGTELIKARTATPASEIQFVEAQPTMPPLATLGFEASIVPPAPAVEIALAPTAAPPAAAYAPTAAPTPEPTVTRTDAPVPPAPTPTMLPIPVRDDRPKLAMAMLVEDTPTPTPSYAGFKPYFAPFKDPTIRVKAVVPVVPLETDLQNVLVPFILAPEQRERLQQDGIVVSPGVEKEFFTLYENTRYLNLPIFVTSDSLLHTYHLLFDKTLRSTERTYLTPMLHDLNRAMLAETDRQYKALKDPAWKDAARRTVAFVGVASRLLDSKAVVPSYANELVTAELALIHAAKGISPSPIFPGLENGEDYTQYIPRGHYATSAAFKAYFKAMMWYGRMTFRLKASNREVGQTETREALLLANALHNAGVDGKPAQGIWEDIYTTISFFVGRSDDLTVADYGEVMDAVYGHNPGLDAIADDAKLQVFLREAQKLPAPRILGMVISSREEEEAATKGLRFMGQRFVPDAYIFRQLIWPNVGEETVHRRGLPKGLDLLAAMGSPRAYQQLEAMGDTNYLNYIPQMRKVQDWTSSPNVEDWTETLYTSWLYSFQPLLDTGTGGGYPAFMQGAAWQDKQLNTVLGSWAELKHDTVLAAKQVYAEMGGGGPGAPEPLVLRGYVEPVPLFYARLAALVDMTTQGLEGRNMLGEQDKNSLGRLKELALAFQTMAEKELQGQPLAGDEYDTILYYGGDLEHLTMAAADVAGAEQEGGTPMMDKEPQAAVIADVATDPDPEGTGSSAPVVLEVGVGRIDELYAVVPMVADDGSTTLQVARGGTFAYYEFPWPADDRLTDAKWHQMLDEDQSPPPLEWTSSFAIDQTGHTDLQGSVNALQMQVTEAYWGLDTTYLTALDAMPEGFAAELETLREQNQYIGHQLVSTDYRSYDRQTTRKVVVAVRETWQDFLYDVTDYPGDGESDPISRRGPYTLDVTYTLERSQPGWRVTKAVYANQPPEW